MAVVRTIVIGGKEVPYTLTRKIRHPRMTLSVRRGGRVTVTVARTTPLSTIDQFVASKRQWLADVLARLSVLHAHDPRVARSEYEQHKEAARALVHRELLRLNAHYGFVYGRVSIRATTSRWGSCSSKKNLNFSYRVLFLPPGLREYVLVHELCHLKEMNHGSGFWELVAELVPDYRVRRKAVRAIELV
jgi:predicted metal-dependent hydrolase